MTLTLLCADVFVGAGGRLLDNDGGAATPTNYVDDTVANGTLGFRATVGTLTLVSIKDRGASLTLTTDDTNYLGVALDNFAGDLVGLDDLLKFHAWGVDAVLNSAKLNGVAATKLDWSALTTEAGGLNIATQLAALNGTSFGALVQSVDRHRRARHRAPA